MIYFYSENHPFTTPPIMSLRQLGRITEENQHPTHERDLFELINDNVYVFFYNLWHSQNVPTLKQILGQNVQGQKILSTTGLELINGNMCVCFDSLEHRLAKTSYLKNTWPKRPRPKQVRLKTSTSHNVRKPIL